MKLISYGKVLGYDLTVTDTLISSNDAPRQIWVVEGHAKMVDFLRLEIKFIRPTPESLYLIFRNGRALSINEVVPIEINIIQEESDLDNVTFTARIGFPARGLVLGEFTFEMLRFIDCNDTTKIVGECLYRAAKNIHGNDIP